jgi:hypothetical protein
VVWERERGEAWKKRGPLNPSTCSRRKEGRLHEVYPCSSHPPYAVRIWTDAKLNFLFS